MALQLPTTLGPWQAKVTRIKQMWAQPCAINPIVWFAGYFAATPELAISFLAPDCIDHTADRVRGGHRRRRKGSINVADFADRLSAPGKGEQWVGYSLLRWAQHIGFYLTLIDATQNWVILGTSFAYQWSGCADPNEGYAQSSFQEGIPALFLPGDFLISIWQNHNAHIYVSGPDGIIVPRGHAAGCGFSLTSHPNPAPPLPEATWTARLVDISSDREYAVQTPTLQADGSRTITFAAPITNNAADGGHFQVWGNKTAGVLKMSGTLSSSGSNLEGMTKSACGHSIGGF